MKFFLLMFYFIILKTNVESAILTISPGIIIQAGAPNLTIRCQPSPGEVTSIKQLVISRTVEGESTDKVMGTVDVGKSPELGTGFESPKYTVTGSIKDTDSVSTEFLQIVIQEPDGNDKGHYGCIVTRTGYGSTVTSKKTTYVTVQDNRSGCAKQFRVTDTTAVTVLGVLVALYCCFFI